MGDIGVPELLVILVIVLVIFGAGRLTEIMRALGQGVAEFRRGANDVESPPAASSPTLPTPVAPPLAGASPAAAATPPPPLAGAPPAPIPPPTPETSPAAGVPPALAVPTSASEIPPVSPLVGGLPPAEYVEPTAPDALSPGPPGTPDES